MTKTELKLIIKLAQNRRATQIARLAAAKRKRDDVACDLIYVNIAHEDEIISNAQLQLDFANAKSINEKLDMLLS